MLYKQHPHRGEVGGATEKGEGEKRREDSKGGQCLEGGGQTEVCKQERKHDANKRKILGLHLWVFVTELHIWSNSAGLL